MQSQLRNIIAHSTEQDRIQKPLQDMNDVQSEALASALTELQKKYGVSKPECHEKQR
jgi:uncharacterized protein YllA (UPF0747 family)